MESCWYPAIREMSHPSFFFISLKEREKFARNKERILMIKARLELRALRQKQAEQKSHDERLDRMENMLEGKYS